MRLSSTCLFALAFFDVCVWRGVGGYGIRDRNEKCYVGQRNPLDRCTFFLYDTMNDMTRGMKQSRLFAHIVLTPELNPARAS